jgi:ribosomal protein S18 acetylase RimI-like enzyme
MKILIRKCDIADIEKLLEISRTTFSATFSTFNTVENMEKYLSRHITREKLLDELKNPGSEFYFAMNDEQVIGYLKLNRGKAQTELKSENSLEIERIYVVKQYQGEGMGKLLLSKAIESARNQDMEFIWLGVWEKNEKAISFYQKSGFKTFDKHLFRLGDDEQVDIMMRLML